VAAEARAKRILDADAGRRAAMARAVLPPALHDSPFDTDMKGFAVEQWTGFPAEKYGNETAIRGDKRLRYAAAVKREQVEARKQAEKEAVKEALTASTEYGPFSTAQCIESWGISDQTWRNWHKGIACPSGVRIRKLNRGRWMVNQNLPQAKPSQPKIPK